MNYLITLLFLLLTSSANFLALNDVSWFVIMLLMVGYALVKKLLVKRDLKVMAIFLVVYLAYVGIRYVFLTNAVDGFSNMGTEFLLSDVIFPFKYALLAFIYIVIVRDQALENIVNVMVHLTIISLVLFAVQMVAGDAIYGASEAIGISPKGIGIPGYTNFIIFTFTEGRHDFRNSGFVWEPGAFGCFLIIAILFNFFRNKFKFDKKAIILIIGLITTFSTTDYIAFLLMLFMIYRYRVPKLNLWVFIMIPAFIILIIVVPFLGQKIADIYIDDIKGLDALRHYSKEHVKHADQIPLNRFASMIYLWDNLGWNLFLGVSNKYDAIINTNYTINISNGIFDFFAKFGFMGFVYLIYSYARFCGAFIKRNELKVYCVLILLLIGFGEPIMFLPITLLFLFLPLITNIGNKEDEKSNNPELA